MVFTLATFATIAITLSTASISYGVPVELEASPVFLKRQLEIYGTLTTRGDSSCHLIKSEEFQRLPSWSKVVKYAEDTYGSTNTQWIANPPEYPSQALQACIPETRIAASFSGQPECTTNRHTLTGKSVGTGAEGTAIEYSFTNGMKETASWTVTESSAFSYGATFGISVGIKGAAEASSEVSMQTSITNEASSSFASEVNTEATVKFAYKNEEGKKCNFEQATQICRGKTTGRVPLVADGWFWFFFHDPQTPKNDPESKPHYKWAINIAEILSEEERTTYVTFEGPTDSVIHGQYETICDKI